jgi:repressor LexA
MPIRPALASLPATPRQLQVLEFVRRFIATKGYPPTRTEIAIGFGFRSANAAEEHLQALHNKGLLRLTPSVSRGITLEAQA